MKVENGDENGKNREIHDGRRTSYEEVAEELDIGGAGAAKDKVTHG